ncbi:hypothetical protein K7X08_036339 [Anisodus acutangulus]|uniref:Uncharacterized protein n=1 Tax=Anisodus acutangulus TaxID=402998 RepID=A0A9Q1L670_9SOLA|nr:hypothetical protein K7X08_036339 [Anisodus acutangulus]
MNGDEKWKNRELQYWISHYSPTNPIYLSFFNSWVLYHPQDIVRKLQKVDYNLYGMGHLHVSKMKFRNPIPDTFPPRKDNYVDRRRPSDMSISMTAECQVDLAGEACFDTPIWISSTIPDNWMWKYSSQADPSTDLDDPNIKRQSISELEGDATVDGCLEEFARNECMKWACLLILVSSDMLQCSEEGLLQEHVVERREETDACPKQLLADHSEATVSVVSSQDVKASDQDAL